MHIHTFSFSILNARDSIDIRSLKGTLPCQLDTDCIYSHNHDVKAHLKPKEMRRDEKGVQCNQETMFALYNVLCGGMAHQVYGVALCV